MPMSSAYPVPKRSRGFTLVEIMIVVVIIGLLAAMAIPAFSRVRENSRHSTLANDIRIFAAAFETYALEHGSFPADTNIGVLPPAMLSGNSTLDADAFAAKTPIGGNYDWDYNVFGVVAAVSVADATITTAELTRFDAKFDDGDLTTGQFRGNTGRYSYVLQF
ncbi:type II secretion system protein [Actomonas aquatica]|uniref:Prepilin-type N-terminal cleavage/methylation domain-containing protein n=1 Tax=Actomonas aquatica TaxID=2866162 RepID=A0ABZ1CH92_9BACT|nr:prepilin-type N-terminal cleavage/methylation domain-containing protein [Opitutus sp. WL0086]WRQ89640.1 prepilin-type N-terminal cleavage/methylation domain-containing protein [Opitutus sp. WL0086]